MDLILKPSNAFTLDGESPFKEFSRDSVVSLLHRCRTCPLVRPTPFLPKGPLSADTVIVGPNPNPSEETLYGQVYDSILEYMGFRTEDTYRTYSIHCPTPGNRLPSVGEIGSCSTWKTWELDQLPNSRFFFLMGAGAVSQFMGFSPATMEKLFWEVHGVHLLDREIHLLPCYSPRTILQRDDLRPALIDWCRKVGDFIRVQRIRNQRNPDVLRPSA